MSKTYSFIYLLIVFFITFTCPSETIASRIVTIMVNRIVCHHYDPEIVTSLGCNLVRDEDERFININFTLGIDVADSLMGAFEIRWLRGKDEIPYLKLDMNICDILGTNFDHFLLKMIKSEVHRASNMPLKCPIKKDYPYYIRNFNIGINALPSYMPEVTFKQLLNFTYNGQPIAGFDAEGVLKKRTLRKKARYGY